MEERIIKSMKLFLFVHCYVYQMHSIAMGIFLRLIAEAAMSVCDRIQVKPSRRENFFSTTKNKIRNMKTINNSCLMQIISQTTANTNKCPDTIASQKTEPCNKSANFNNNFQLNDTVTANNVAPQRQSSCFVYKQIC